MRQAHLLPPRTRSTTTELLGLHTTGVSNEEGTVVGDEGLLQFEGGGGILVLGVETGSQLWCAILEACPNVNTHATMPLAMA
jgi:hypothetical protein